MKAIVMCGFGRRNSKKEALTSEFMRDCKFFIRYLVKRVGLKTEDVHFLKPGTIKTMRLWGLLETIKEIVRLNPNEPLLVSYSGHGEAGYWNLRPHTKEKKTYYFKFKQLIRILKKRNAPLIVVADCCYGMSIRKELKKLDYPWLLIGLAPQTRVGYGSIGQQAMLYWSRNKPANPKYDNGNGRLLKFLRFKSYNKKFYGFKPNGKRGFRKFYFLSSYKMKKVNLRAGTDLDYLLYPKK